MTPPKDQEARVMYDEYEDDLNIDKKELKSLHEENKLQQQMQEMTTK